MNRLFTILCMVTMLVFHTSCNDSVMDIESPSVGLKTSAVDQRVQNLIQQARLGDVEAYNSLALCYRDGDGVEQSWLNMICMYAIYCQKTGGDIEDVIELFDEGNPFRLIFIIAAITAIVDIVPVLGTGTIVIPWAVYNLFTGNYGLAIGLFVIYACITVIRQVIEPKLVATQLGIPAFLTITSMFIGSQIFGVIGIFILPITIVMLKLLNDEGIINILHYPKEEISKGDEKK